MKFLNAEYLEIALSEETLSNANGNDDEVIFVVGRPSRVFLLQ